MRIALMAWEALHAVPVGAAAVYAFRLASAFAARGHDVHLFTRLGAGQRLDDVVSGIRYHRVPVERRASFYDEIQAQAAPFVHYLRAERERAGPFDRLHAVDWLALPAAFLALDSDAAAPADRRPPLAVTYHTTEWGRAGAWPEHGTARAIAELEREGVERADAVVAVTDRVRRELDSLYRPPDWKIDTIRHGLDPQFFRREPFDAFQVKRAARLPPEPPFLLFAGRLDGRRGAALALAAYAEYVRHPSADATLALVGDGPERVELLREAERLGVAGRVVFAGECVGEALAGLYRAADLVLAPSDSFASGALSAWAAGRPVVAGTDSGSAEVVLEGVNGWIRPRDPRVWAELFRAALGEPDRLRWMGANGGAAFAAAFTWDVVAERTMELYSRRRRLAEKTG